VVAPWFPVVTGLPDLPRVKVEGVRDEQWLGQGTAPKAGPKGLLLVGSR
jgi:hypothetical protein